MRLSVASGNYKMKDSVAAAAVGAEKEVVFAEPTLIGGAADNYEVTESTFAVPPFFASTIKGAITPRPLTLDNVVLLKPHDGGTGIAGATVSADIGNVVDGEAVTLSLKSGATGAFDSATQGSGKTITGLSADDLEITVTGGHGADSYSLPTGAITATGRIVPPANSDPSKVTGVSAATGSVLGNLDVSWTALNDNSIYAYAYRWSNDGDASDWESAGGAGGVEFAGGGTTDAYTITGLAGHTDYVVQIAARNSRGTGPWSDSSAAAVALGVPLAPSDVQLTAAVTTIEVRWTAPTDTGGSAITGYKIRWGKIVNGELTWLNANGDAGQDTSGGTGTLSETISNLKSDTEHTVQVAAVNAGGTGAFSAAQTATPTVPNDLAEIRVLKLIDSNGEVVALTPAFSPATTEYTATLNAENVRFKPTYFGAENGVVVDGNSANTPRSGHESNLLTNDFTSGQTRAITLVVTAKDGTTTKPTPSRLRARTARRRLRRRIRR